MEKPNLLIDSFGYFTPHLVEDKQGAGGRLVIRGEFARADIPTENNRVYPKTLWEREIKRLAKPMSEKKVLATSDHPDSGRTSLKDVSHVITKLWMEGNVVMGEAEVLNTAVGKDIKAILEATGHLGVSSRGFGTTQVNQEGKDVVQDNYKLQCFDFVADPANVTSYPKVHTESNAGKGLPVKTEKVMEEKLTLEKLRQTSPTVYENLRDEAEREFEKRGAAIWAKKIEAARTEASTDLRGQVAIELKAAIEAAKVEVAQQEREKLLNDPTVAGAKNALEGLKDLLRPYIVPEDIEAVLSAKNSELNEMANKLAEAELSVANLKTENEKLALMAKEAGFKYHLETILKDVPEADLIKSVIGDVKAFEDLDSLNTRISGIVDEIKKQAVKQEERDTEMERIKLENVKLREATEKSLEVNKLLMVENYIEERLKHHPKASEIRVVFENKMPESQERVDEVISKFREKQVDRAQLDEARARVRKLVGSNAVETISENVDNPRESNQSNTNYNGLGVDAESLRALSGMGTEN